MGKEMTKGIADNLNFGSILSKSSVKGLPLVRQSGAMVGAEFAKQFANQLDFGRMVTLKTAKGMAATRTAGMAAGREYGKAFARGFELETRHLTKPKIDLDMTRARLQIDALKLKLDNAMKSAGPSMSQTALRALLGVAVRGGGGGAGGGGIAAAGGGAGFIGGINALIKALPGGTSGSIGAVPAPILAGAGAITALAAPFIAQMLAGFVPLLGGGALAGLGIAGAFGAGGTNQQQVAQARAAAQAANARVRAAQARLSGLGGGGPTALATSAAGLSLSAAQARLTTAQGGTSAAAILSAEAGVARAQDRINKLRSSGKVSTAQLASAEAALASARATQSKASTAYQKAQADQITAGQQALRDSFKHLAQDAKQSLGQIGAPMVPVMRNLLGTVDSTLKKMTPIFTGAIKTISGPFGVFSHDIINTFASPQVKSSIQAVAQAFADVMTAFTPDIPGIMNSFADAIERISKSVSKNPKAFADFLNFVFQFGIMLLNGIAFMTEFANFVEMHFMPVIMDIGHAFVVAGHYIEVQWDQMWQDTIGRTIRAQRRLQTLINGWLHNVAHWFDVARHGVSQQWDLMWQDTIGRTIRAQRRLQQLISIGLHNIANAYDILRHQIASIWDTTWNNTIGRARRGYSDLMGLFHRLKQDINNWFLNAGTWLTNVGHNIIQGMLNGMKNAMSNISGWVKSIIVDPIVNWVKHHFGIASPSTVMAGIGGNLVEGLLRGLMSSAGSVGKVVVKIFGSIPNALGAIVGKGLIALEKLPASALKLLGGLGGKIGHFFSNLFHGGPAGAGVQRWAGTVLQALAMLHMPAGLLPRILYQMQTESGGNPNAINLTDINAQRGDPSRGLMQTIGSTFAAYHVPGTSNNIYDPLANIAAAINYARHVYGPTLGALGSGHGYAAGTGGATPGWAWVGERGPELVNFVGGEMVLPNGALGGYASGTASAAESLAAHNRALAMAAAAFNRMAKAGASLAAAIAKITPKTTAGVFASDQAKFLADLRLYFTPSVAKARSQLVINQIKQLQSLQTHIKTLSANIANATAFQQQELAHLRSTGGIGAIGIQGVGAAGGRSILTGLSGQLTNMRNFGYAVRDLSRAGGSQALLRTVAAMDPASGTVYARKMISALNKMHSMKLSPEMINQLVALGPDAALAYVNAIQAAGPSVLRQIKSTEAALASATLGTSRGIASVVSGGAYNTGANFVAGLKSQEKSLEKQFAHLGRVLGQEAIKWMHVPANKRPYGYQHGGWLNEPVSGIGMYTGASYTFAETGREYVLPEGQMGARGGDGDSYHAHFDGLTGEAIESHVRTAFAAMSLTRGSLNRQGRRS